MRAPLIFLIWASEPPGLIDEVAQGLAGQESPAVVEDDVVTPLVEIGAIAGRVRRQQHPGM